MSAPTIVAGPAVISRGVYTYRSQGDITSQLIRNTWSPSTSLAGQIDTRLVSQLVEHSFTPDGALDTVAKYLPFAISNIGTMLFSDTAATVKTKAGENIVWGNTAITRLPSFRLGPGVQAHAGTMTITALATSSKDLDDSDAYNAITSTAFSDTTFDETKIVSGRYTAAWGSESAPFDAIQPEDHFQFEVVMETSPKVVASYGVVNMMLTGLTAVVRFIPANLTEAQMWTLMQLQGADALLPGQSLSNAGNDLVISDGTRSFTLHNAGPERNTVRYGLQPLRPGEVAFTSRKTWSTGTANPLVTLSF